MPLNRQDAFDTMLKGLLKQGKLSMADGGSFCAYRGSGGRKCAVGMLIPDEVYDCNLEGANPSSPKFDRVAKLLGWSKSDREWLGAAQSALHDSLTRRGGFAKALGDAADRFAEEHGLQVNI